VLAANMETALNGLWDSGATAGDRIVVIGAGPVGCLTAYLAGRLPGADVTLCDIRSARAETATALGVRFATPDRLEDTADVVFHASGAPPGLVSALHAAAFEATIVEMSWYGTAEVSLPLGAAFHARRLTVKSSQVGHVAVRQRARWPYARRMAMALSLLRDPRLDALTTGESDFESLPETLRRLTNTPGEALLHRIRY
jgi:threonine dehydrogenase-like Zn-dependent dehydrogenase